MTEKCLVCGEETDEYPIYEVVNLTKGGETVGYLCSDCAKKAPINNQERRTGVSNQKVIK